jgi:hypothetical protein
MINIKKTLKERTSGLFLIIFAVFIIAGISISSHRAESENRQNLADINQASTEGQILGEEKDNPEEIADNPGETEPVMETDNENANQEGKQEEKTEKITTVSNSEDDYYNDLKNRLKKYCGNNFNVKKCQDYLKEAKDAREKGARFKELYKKYHFEKKEDNESSSSVASSSANSATASLAITSGGNSKSYSITSPSGISVIGLMDLLQKDSSQNFFYHSSSGFVDKINGTENSGNMSWMLYSCKGGTCKLSSVGALDCKIDDWDKIEWKYLDWTMMDWITW